MAGVRRYTYCRGVYDCQFADDDYNRRHSFRFPDFEVVYAGSLPFGREIRSCPGDGGCLSVLMNIIWILVGGIWISLSHLAFGVLLCITVIGIPFGLQHFKLAGLALTPFGKEIV
mgnify:CR=1 FL=1